MSRGSPSEQPLYTIWDRGKVCLHHTLPRPYWKVEIYRVCLFVCLGSIYIFFTIVLQPRVLTKQPSMEVNRSSKPMIATQQQMVESKVPLAYRDQCAHLLIPLNKCRQSEFYLPWKCENERHSYEKCEYELVMERMLQMQKLKQSNKQEHGSHIQLVSKTANA